MTDTRQALLQAVLADPDDDAPRLALADWLEENGQGERAAFVRVQCELAKAIDWVSTQGVKHYHPDADLRRVVVLERRERELLSRVQAATDKELRPGGGEVWWSGWQFERGFLASITLPCAAFLRFGPALFAAQPITEVRLSDKRPLDLWNGQPDDVWAGYHTWSAGCGDAADYLPPELYHRLRGGRPTDHVHVRYYSTEADALADLCAACIAWAKATEPAAA